MRPARRLIPLASISLLLVALLIAALVAVRMRGSQEAAGPRFDWYLALGDSLTAGVGAAQPAENGYVGRVQRTLAENGNDALPGATNLAVPGATTRSMIAGGQLQRALDFLRANRDRPGLVTISIGGNDGARLYAPCAFGSIEVCRQLALDAVATSGDGMGTILQALEEAAGDATRIVVLTYYNPLQHPGCVLHAQQALANAVLEGGAPLDLPSGLNALIRDRATGVGALVVDLREIGEPELTADCLHPNTDGHARIARKVLDALQG